MKQQNILMNSAGGVTAVLAMVARWMKCASANEQCLVRDSLHRESAARTPELSPFPIVIPTSPDPRLPPQDQRGYVLLGPERRRVAIADLSAELSRHLGVNSWNSLGEALSYELK